MSTLNQGQKNASDAFFKMLLTDQSEMIISGPAGTGKTYLMGHMIDDVMPSYSDMCKLIGELPVYNNVVMLATTNKAAEVLAESIGREVLTVHSFFNLRVKEDFTNGRTVITKTHLWKVHKNLIIFIDEYTMIDSTLLKYIREGTHNCKIIYVGDSKQLGPVMEGKSPVADKGIPEFELTEPMRNAGYLALVTLCTQLRNNVDSLSFDDITLVPGVIDWFTEDQMINEVKTSFYNLEHNNVIVAYTNDSVSGVNEYIRNLRGLPEDLQVGEHVINNSAITLGNSLLRVQQQFTITKRYENTLDFPIDARNTLTVRHYDVASKNNVYTKVPVPVDKNAYNSLIKHYSKNKDWRHYFLLKNNFPDFRAKDAITIHKSQGSTYDTVYIDVGDLSTCKQPNTVARLLFVAVSRAKQRVVFYGKLLPKYGKFV